MRKFYTAVVNHRKLILVLFAIAFVVCFVCSRLVSVNYDMKNYLPDGTKSTVSIEIMQEQFSGGIPNARAMVKNVSIPEALEIKEKIKAVDGVSAVTWLDDSVDISIPLSMLDTKTVESYYKDSNAIFTITIEDDKRLTAVEDIRAIIGDSNAMTGGAVSTADATATTVTEVMKVTVIAVIFTFAVLTLTTTSWIAPIVVLIGLGLSIMLNNGSNIIFGEISFVTNASGSVLLLAVALDYSVFLLHRFSECREKISDTNEAMVDALCKSTSSILSSGLTTVIGFLALILMQFRLGADLGLALAKGVLISLITVFIFTPSLILCTVKLLDKTKHRSFMPSFKFLGKAVQKMAIPMVCIFAIIIIPSYLGSNANDYLYGSSEIFTEETRYGKDTKAIEEVFGKSDTYVLLVPKGDTVKQQAISNELHKLPEVTGIISFVDMAGAEIPPSYLEESQLSQLEGKDFCRMVISANVPAEGEQTFALVENIRAIAEKYYPDSSYLAGEGVSTYDLKDTITADMTLVNLLAIAAVFLVLLITSKSFFVPTALVICIEMAIWLNLAVPYFADQSIFYIAYLIISSVQLGATVDYAILMTDRYKENRATYERKEAVIQTVSDVFVSIMTSGSAMTVVGFLLGILSSNQILAQLGIFIGRGAIFSLLIVFLVLPGILYLFDKLVCGKKKDKNADLQEVTEK